MFGIYLKFVFHENITLYKCLWVIAIVNLCFLVIHSASLVPLLLMDGKHIDIALGFNIVKIGFLMA
jgi:hypothetical protein